MTFTETGAGNSKVSDFTVTAVRAVNVECISATGDISLTNTEEPVKIQMSQGDDPGSATSSYTTDENGNLTGIVYLSTVVEGRWNDSVWVPGDVCPRFQERTEEYVSAYYMKDYSITYSDVTVVDNENGASASIYGAVAPGYTSGWTTIRVGADAIGTCNLYVSDDPLVAAGNC